MSRLFLHVGTPKTGTTAIQGFLNANPALLDGEGVSFVKAGRGPSGHNVLAVRGRDRDEANRLLSAISDEVAARPDHRHVISGEMLFAKGWPALFAAGWSEDLIRDTTVIIYLRRQDKYLEAMYKQHVKVGRFSGTPQEYRDRHFRRMSYRPTVEAYAQVFGDDRVIVTPYERSQFPGGDVVQHFARLIGIEDLDPKALAEREANVTMSREVSEMLGIVQTKAQIGMVPLLRALIASDQPGVARSNDCYLRSEQRAMVEQMATETEAIRARFRPDLDQFFDLKDLDRSLPDKPVSDAERIERMREAQIAVCESIATCYRARPRPPEAPAKAAE